MKILLDMNISPDWVEYLKNEGFEAVHWVSIGWSTAPDT
jgi:predicted nuclease of predicted toxin-antitoxin system